MPKRSHVGNECEQVHRKSSQRRCFHFDDEECDEAKDGEPVSMEIKQLQSTSPSLQLLRGYIVNFLYEKPDGDISQRTIQVERIEQPIISEMLPREQQRKRITERERQGKPTVYYNGIDIDVLSQTRDTVQSMRKFLAHRMRNVEILPYFGDEEYMYAQIRSAEQETVHKLRSCVTAIHHHHHINYYYFPDVKWYEHGQFLYKHLHNKLIAFDQDVRAKNESTGAWYHVKYVKRHMFVDSIDDWRYYIRGYRVFHKAVILGIDVDKFAQGGQNEITDGMLSVIHTDLCVNNLSIIPLEDGDFELHTTYMNLCKRKHAKYPNLCKNEPSLNTTADQ